MLKRMGISGMLPVLLIVSPPPSPAADASRNAAHELPARARALVMQQQVPQIVWAVATDEAVRAGALNPTGIRESPDAAALHFHAASVTKPVTATAIVRLMEQRRIGPDQLIVEVLPELRSDDPRLRKVTIRHLLDHTSGIDDPPRGTQIHDEGVTALVAVVAREPLTFHSDPGASFSYANRNYVLLGAVIERSSGARFDIFVQNEVLRPGGAPSARLSCSAVPAARLAVGHTLDAAGAVVPSRLQPFGRAQAPAGGLCITVRELAEWGLRMSGCDAVAGRYSTCKPPYAMGWYIEDVAGVRLFHHDGTDVGYAASLIVAPERRVAVAVMSNFTFASAGPVARMLVGDLLGPAFGYPEKMPTDEQLRGFAGRYVNAQRGSAWIELAKGELRMTYQQPGFNYEMLTTRLMPKPEWDRLGYYIGSFRGEPIWLAWKERFANPVLYLQNEKFTRDAR